MLTLKTPYRDGTTHIVMSPLEFMQRLAALVPRPRLHLIRFHGVLAPNAKLRAEIIPGGAVNVNAPSAEHSDALPPSAPARMSWARLLKRVFDIDIEQCSQCGGPLKIVAAIEDPTVKARPTEEPAWRAEDAAPRSSPISACPPGDRPDHRHGHSIDSKWPDPKPTPPPVRFISLRRPPPLAHTPSKHENASIFDTRLGRMAQIATDPRPRSRVIDS